MNDRPEIDEEFSKHLSAEDELGVAVRAHIHIEAGLNEFIEKRVPFPKLLPRRMTYETRLRLACALGFNKDYLEILRLLGNIRNSFGHQIDAKLTDSKVNELYSKLPFDGREAVVLAYNATKKQLSEADAPAFAGLCPKDRFVLIAVALKMLTVAANHRAVKLA